MMATRVELFAGPLDGLKVAVSDDVWDDEEPKLIVFGHIYTFLNRTYRWHYERSV